LELVNSLHLLLNINPKKKKTLYLQDIMKIPTFKLGMNYIPSTNQYTYLGNTFQGIIGFLEINIAMMNSKINYTVNFFYRFLTNRNVPSYF